MLSSSSLKAHGVVGHEQSDLIHPPPWRCPGGHSLSKCGIRGQVRGLAKKESPKHPRHKVNHLKHSEGAL